MQIGYIRLHKAAVRRIIYILVILIFIVIGYLFDNSSHDITTKVEKVEGAATTSVLTYVSDTDKIYKIGDFKVTKITDGDTIHVESAGGSEDTVRFLAINTPEIHNATKREVCLGNLAKDFTRESLLDQNIELWGDTTQPKRDKYDRLLAYVFAPNVSTTTFFNDVLMTTGNAKVYKASPVATYYTRYVNYQKEAQKANLQMWNLELCK